MAAKKTEKQCDCITNVNKELAKTNGELDVLHFMMSGLTMVRIAVLKKSKDDRTKPISNMVPHFCPFCGTKYPKVS